MIRKRSAPGGAEQIPEAAEGEAPSPLPGNGAKQPPPCSPASSRGRPPDPERRARILHAAAELFLDHGFAHTSMDRIAQEAGVSKQTVYAHFNSKEDLYRAVIAHKIAEYFPEESVLTGSSQDAERALTQFGSRFLALVLSDDSVAMLRRLIESAEREHKLVRLFDEEGPERILAELTAFCATGCCAVIEGRCRPRGLAELLTSLLLGPYLLRRLLGLIPLPGTAELERHARLCARQTMMLAEHGLVAAEEP